MPHLGNKCVSEYLIHLFPLKHGPRQQGSIFYTCSNCFIVKCQSSGNEKLFVEWNNLADWFSVEAYSVNWNVHWQQIYAWSQKVFQKACVVSFLGGSEMVILVFFVVWYVGLLIRKVSWANLHLWKSPGEVSASYWYLSMSFWDSGNWVL